MRLINYRYHWTKLRRFNSALHIAHLFHWICKIQLVLLNVRSSHFASQINKDYRWQYSRYILLFGDACHCVTLSYIFDWIKWKTFFELPFLVDFCSGISWKSLNASMCRNCGSKTKWSTIDGNRPLNQNTWFLNRWMCVVLQCTTNVCLNDEKWIGTLFWSILNAVGNANSKSKSEIKESGENIVNNKIRIHLLNPQSCTLSECVYLTWHRI